MKICHMTCVHTQEDIRIFHKECVSLADAGYDVYLVSCGETYDKKGVHLIGIGQAQAGRLGRMTRSAKEVYRAAAKLNADVYHFHDPELLPYGLKLKRRGKKVIFDSHEDVPAQILDKVWIPKPVRKLISVAYRAYETHAVKELDAVVTATPHIAEAFKNRCGEAVVVNNYPRFDDIAFHSEPFTQREAIACYAGGIDELRGEKIMLEAMKDVKGTLILAGEHEKMKIPGAAGGVKYVGRLDREGVNALYGSAVVGLCILKPIENYYYSRPIKMYEYMAAGLPFICSDFPGWRKVADESRSGICVNPTDISGITEAINGLLADRAKAQDMGKNGREYVLKYCNWSNEEKSLLSLYDRLERRA